MKYMEVNKEKNTYRHWCCCGKGGLGFGIFLLVVGGYFVAQDLGWIAYDLSFWSVALVAFGLYYVLRSLK